MKTVFKVGMEVYDNIFFPNSKGEVVRIDKHIDCERVIVQFDCLDYELSYTEKGRLTSTYNGSTPTLSTKPYTLQGFEQKAPIPTYEDIVKERNYIYLPENLVAPNKELADAVVALLKLLFLRDYYNEGWQPDFSKETKNTKYCISKDASGRFMKYDYYNYDFNNVLIFKSKQIRSKFWDEQLELMKIAKPLL